MKPLKVSTHARTIETICTVTTDKWNQAKVTVTRYHGNGKFSERVYRVSWYNIGLHALQEWAGRQSFGAPRGLIDIKQNAYVNAFVPAVYYNIHRLKRRETKHQW